VSQRVTRPRLSRILVESAAIVVSILLAFGIDAWWQSHLDRQREREIITALQDDFARNLQSAAQAISFHEAALVRFARLRRMSATEISALPQDSANGYAALAAPYTFDAIRGNLDALIGSGEMGLLRNPRLRESLVTFLNLVDDSGEDARYLGDAAEAVWNERLRLGGPWSGEFRSTFLPVDATELVDPLTATDLLRVLGDRRMIAVMAHYHAVASVYLQVLHEFQTQIEVVEELLADAGAT
jgi:hypothetical protein